VHATSNHKPQSNHRLDASYVNARSVYFEALNRSALLVAECDFFNIIYPALLVVPGYARHHHSVSTVGRICWDVFKVVLNLPFKFAL
jgi:hypothetical protein